MRIYLDLDGVLCDFVGGAAAVYGEDPAAVDRWDFFQGWGLSANDFWGGIDAGGPTFWERLRPYPWMAELVALVRRYDPKFRVATSPSEHANSAAGKVLWIQTHLSEVGAKRRHLSGEKSDLAKRHRVLIDDSPANCAAWCQRGGTAVLFPARWNARRDCTDPVRLVAEELASIRRAEAAAAASRHRKAKKGRRKPRRT